ncbi:MAG: hypothetical protein IJT11_10595 [Bacteroidaceae bacterium]|nr:hypothetical protein [Bacteroidaceae bacterium]
MKKTYTTPTELVVVLQNVNMIAESLGDGGEGGGLDSDVKESADGNGSTGSKNVWDEEW